MMTGFSREAAQRGTRHRESPDRAEQVPCALRSKANFGVSEISDGEVAASFSIALPRRPTTTSNSRSPRTSASPTGCGPGIAVLRDGELIAEVG
jgi:hypothetical protein